MKNILFKPSLLLVLLLTATIGLFQGCGNKRHREYLYNSAFDPWISAFTSRQISRITPITIQLNEDAVAPDQVNYELKESPFHFSPDIEGKAIWVDTRTLEFRPLKPLPSNTFYRAEFDLGKFVTDTPKDLKTFPFQFETVRQSFEVSTDGLENTDQEGLKWMALNGTLITADYEFPEKVEQALQAKLNGRLTPIKWIHSQDNMVHTFRVDSIRRQDDPGAVILNWTGYPMDLDLKGELSVTIPALGDFQALTAMVYNEPEQRIEISFSDPLLARQDLEGLIRLDEGVLNLVIEGSKVMAYPASGITGSHTLTVERGIRNVLGYKLQKPQTWDLEFEEQKPQVRLVGSGNILPHTDGLPFVFETVSLKSVHITVSRIFGDNVLQFLQVNELDGGNELYRVARTVRDTTVSLDDKKTNLKQWNRHIIDLSKIVTAEPGAIYRVKVSFTQDDALYGCAERTEARKQKETAAAEGDFSTPVEEDSYWDEYEENYDDSDDDDWNNYWDNRDNPCHPAYYTYEDRSVSRNVLASDLGLIAKRGTDGSMLFTVSDLRTTAPLSGVTLELYDFTSQLIVKTTTNGEGIATLKVQEHPFALIAKSGSQRGYLKLDNGNSLSLSRFDVAGATYEGGVKGFIYGERGVWRPGDTLFLHFLLEDKNKTLPQSHPVTLSLFNPRGQRILQQVNTSPTGHIYAFSVPTPASAPTGDYRAEVSVGGSVFTKNLKIETIMPNRLKIDIDFGKTILLSNEKNLKGKLTSRWLHGAPARGLQADVKMTLSSAPAAFSKYSDYTFNDPVRQYASEYQEVFEGSLSEEGVVDFPLEVKGGKDAPGMLQANFVTRVYESGGNFSSDYMSIKVHPYERYVGLRLPKGDRARGMLLTDQNHTVNIAMVDPNGNPTGTDSVKVSLYKLSWEWWWDQSSELVTNYNGKFFTEEIRNDKVAVKNGAGTWTFQIKYPSWGRYLIRVEDEKGHCTGKIFYADWPGWAGRARSENPEGATMLTFTADKTEYKVGEAVSLTIPTGEAGRALVSLETGSKVLKADWVEAAKGGTHYSFTTTPEMAPGVYVHITLVQPHAQTANDLPMRMYGVLPVKVTDPLTQLSPVITMSPVLQPEQNVSIRVSEAKGQAMAYTVAVVDEGLLDLTRFSTPDPWNYFYAKEALQVHTWDQYDQVIGALGNDFGKLLAIGGDGSGTQPKEGSELNRFRPVVKVLGPFLLKAGETKTHTFKMPNYVGSVRTMVVAGYQGAYGRAEKSTPVRKPLMVLGTLPRVVGPGEKITLPVNVFAMETQVKDVSVTIEASDLFTITGNKTKNIKFTKVGDQVVDFALDVKQVVGKGKVKITAKSGAETAVYNVEVEVRNPNPRVVDAWQQYVEPGQSWIRTFKYPGIAGTNGARIEVTTVPPLNLGKRLRYLINYPHGCIEQTTSSVFPQLYLTQLMDVPEKPRKQIETNIRMGIERLTTQFQQPGGGMSYWPGTGHEDPFGTNYAGTFLLEAKKAGYNVPSSFTTNWIKYQRNAAKNWVSTADYGEQLIQADRLYLLAAANSPELGAMNRMRESGNLTNVSQWRLAAAYFLAGQPEIADKLTQNLTTEVKPYQELTHTYGGDLRDKAIILECMSIMNKRTQALPLMKFISDQLGRDEYLSTQSTGYCLVALARYAGIASQGKPGITFEYRYNKGEWKTVTTTKPMAQVDLPAPTGLEGEIEVRSKTATGMHVSLFADGIPAVGDQKRTESGLKMEVRYLTLEGEEIKPDRLVQGTDFVAEVSVTNPTDNDYFELSLTQIFPGGWEILNPRMMGTDFGQAASAADYQDIRDDRVYTYFDIRVTGKRYAWWYWDAQQPKVEKTKVYRVLLNASYLGRFYLPTVYAEAMYDETISARIPGHWVEVVRTDAVAGN